jgi:phosphonate transport system substrate-binding protein
MSSATPDANPPDSEPPVAPAHVFGPGTDSPPVQESTLSTKRILVAALPLVAVVGFAGGMVYHRASQVKRPTLSPALIGAAQQRLTRGLDPKFTDADKDLVADPPKDAAALVDPETLVFSYIATDDPKNAEATWRPLMDRIAEATGKKVVYLAGAHDADDQITALQEGRLHVTGFNTGNVPVAVNRAGFVPFCVMAAADGTYSYEMEIIVPADSPIKGPADLKGRTMTFTDLGSNSGFKAPLVLLRNNFRLEPGIDFDVNVSYSHEKSIEGIAKKKFEAASVANEVLKRAISRGLIQESEYRSIYHSEAFPPAAIGYVYNLKPELAQKLRAAVLEFDWKGTPLEKAYGPAGKVKFVPISYKDQWSFVREIDDEIGRMPGYR